MPTAAYIKDPDAKLDYYIDWSAWLADDTLDTSTWVATDGVTLSDAAIVGDLTLVWVAGGTAGETVALTNHIVTAAGREEDRTIYLIIREH